MILFKKLLLSIALCLSLLSCADESAKLIPKPDSKTTTLTSDNIIFSPKLDILFVIDNSYSMDIHQANLVVNLKSFVDQFAMFKALDYQIGVISTDQADFGKLQGNPSFVTKNTIDGVEKLKRNLQLGVGGSGAEEIFYPLQMAFKGGNLAPNLGFFRPDAILAIIMITDTDDQSFQQYTAQNTYDMFLNFKSGNAKKLTAFAILADNITCQGEGVFPIRIRDFLALFNGQDMSLCATDYGDKLASFGSDLRKLVSELPLPNMPVPETIRVSYGKLVIPQSIKKGWAYNPVGNSIKIGSELDLSSQPDGLNFTIRYETYKPED